ncbi:hypothetical protein EJG51_009090 [Undibacterium piscinae]|uniref:Uncharacterized protein n=1 Tax=Undibacterium piscinae TaxID=2495591 RepID=A0A6M4A5J5_9BURK|nr:hypothetical protein EJG51_009090 [Undibacterium piscinae]
MTQIKPTTEAETHEQHNEACCGGAPAKPVPIADSGNPAGEEKKNTWIRYVA